MKKIIYIIILLINCDLSAQTVTVYDSVNQKILPFANIMYDGKGLYTNEKGQFILPNNIKNRDSIILSHMGYETIFYSTHTYLRDTLFLSPTAIMLKEVIIPKPNKQSFNIKFLKKPKKFNSWPLGEGFEILTKLIPSDKNADAHINEISLILNKLSNYEIKNNIDNSAKKIAIFRLNIYMIENDSISTKIYSSLYKEKNNKKDKEILFDISDEYITFSKNGLFFGIEYIGRVDTNGNIINNKGYIRLALTNKKSDEYFQKTLLRYMFSNEINKITIDDAMKDAKDRNLSISLKITKDNN